MSEIGKLTGKTYICVSRELPKKNPDDEKEPIETIDIGMLIDNDSVDWDRFDGKRTAKVTYEVEEEKKSKIKIPFMKPKKKKVEKTVDAIRNTKNADLTLIKVPKQEVIEAAKETIGTGDEVPLVVEVYHDVGQYDAEDLQSALTIREYHRGIEPDLKIMGWTKEVTGDTVIFSGEVVNHLK
jgi:23S rRNA G2069 N7-methylase RlmK/C1962 C5-methylase RlmI